MAVPKVCGTETEFGFVLLNPDGSQCQPGDDLLAYEKATVDFVGGFLLRKNFIKYDRSQESPLQSVIKIKEPEEKESKENLKEEKINEKELEHRLRIWRLSLSADSFLPNGARFYLDDAHPEYCTPECILPLELVAHDKAGELFLMQVQRDYRKRFGKDTDRRILIHKNNSDGRGKSYASHFDALLSVETVSDGHDFSYLVRQYVPFQIARLILIGGGKMGAENNAPECDFQISQRADFFERLVGVGTTFMRPIFNTRDEPHANYRKYFRLHDISPDSLMCEHAIFLRAALTQIVLAMIEDRFLKEDWFPEKPVEAIKIVSRDLRFQNPIVLSGGRKITGLELLRKYLICAERYLLSANPMTSQHQAAVKMAFQILEQLEQDPRKTFGKLDWTTARVIMDRAPERFRIKKLLNFREISPDGLYYRWRAAGKIPRLLDDEVILRALAEPPSGTRAVLRSALIKKFQNNILRMNWDSAWVVDNGRNLDISLKEPLLDREYYAPLLSELGL